MPMKKYKSEQIVTVVMPPIEPGLTRVPASSRFRDKGHSWSRIPCRSAPQLSARK